MARPVFKDYSQNQLTCFPADLGTLIAESSPARIVSMVVDKLDVSEVIKTYKFGGASSYHPKMMLKIVFFAYMNNVFSCRKIERQLKENVNHNLNRLKRQAFDLLTSPDGLVRRSRRPIEPEAVFGQIKTCMGYKRFRHFGIGKCYMDFGILAIAFNLLKLSRLKGGNPPEKLKSWICGFILLFFGVKRANYFQNCFPAENNKKVCLKNLKLLFRQTLIL